MNSPIETSKSAKPSGKGIADDQLVGVAIVSKGYTESLEFPPALRLIISGKKSVATNEVD